MIPLIIQRLCFIAALVGEKKKLGITNSVATLLPALCLTSRIIDYHVFVLKRNTPLAFEFLHPNVPFCPRHRSCPKVFPLACLRGFPYDRDHLSWNGTIVDFESHFDSITYSLLLLLGIDYCKLVKRGLFVNETMKVADVTLLHSLNFYFDILIYLRFIK